MAWLSLCGAVWALGMRHGLDADHLAAIDALTRYNLEIGSRVSKWCGALFSLGHGCVVVAIAVSTGAAITTYRVPAWAQTFGAWASILFLFGLGLLNLRTVLRAPADEIVRIGGLRSSLFFHLMSTCQPLAIIAIGSLFAISLDTLSQAALFAATATQFGGARAGATLGMVFMLGMLLVDGLNGAWVATLLKKEDRRARIVSRALGLFVAILSFGVGTLGVLRYFSHDANTVLGDWGMVIGLGLVLTVAGVIVLIGRVAQKTDGETERLRDRRNLPQV
jgi:high-affinity nickel-transport protein